MSVQAISWAIQTTIRTALSHCPSHILIILANYANQDGHSWPSQAHIAESCGMSKRQVIRGLKALEDAGHITRQRRYSETTGFQVSCMYHLEFDLSDIVSPSDSGRLSDKTARLSDKSVGPKCHSVTPLDTKVDTKEDTKKDAREKTRVFVSENVDKSNPKKSTRRAKLKDQEPQVPDWLPKGAWQEWLKHRKQLKSPMTAYAQALLIKKLDRLRAKHDPVDLLETAIVNGWKSVYEPRGNGNGTRETKLSAAEQVEQASEKWYRDRHGGKTFEEQQVDFEQRTTAEVHGTRIQ